MNVVTLSGLKTGRVSRRYRSKCKTKKAYSPVLQKEVLVCEDTEERPQKKQRSRKRKSPPECSDFGWAETKSGRRICKCKTPGNNRIQPNNKCLRDEG